VNSREIPVITTLAILADYEGYDHMDGWGGGWMWLWGAVMMTFFVVLIVWLIRAGSASAGPAPRDPSGRAREILAERYARGELSPEEYRERVGEFP
jgi:putative membrane protein